jgi:S1-C subfamily serine protease
MKCAKVLILGIIILASYIGTAYAHESSVNEKVRKARKSFALIKVNVLIKPVSCTYASQTGLNLSREKCDISSYLPKTLKSVGSGAVIKHVLNKTYVLTAAHVCSHPRTDTRIVGHKEITVHLVPSAIVRDVSGNDRFAKIFALDVKNDLCILEVNGKFGHPLPVAKKMPPLPSLVFSYGAPLGINHPGMVLFYTGYSAGPHYDDNYERTTYFYTLVIRGGSSGSSIINNEGEIIGVVHTAIVGLQKMAIAANLKSIRSILKHVPRVGYEKNNSN